MPKLADKRIRDKEWLYKEYIIKEKTVQNISKETGSNRETIVRWLNIHNILLRTRRESSRIGDKRIRDKEWLYNEYITKKRTQQNIAKGTGSALGTITIWLKKHGIPIRSISEAQKIRIVSKETREKMKSYTHFAGKSNPKYVENWEDLGYCGRHYRIRKEKIKPERCEECNKEAKRLELANIDWEYSDNPDMWKYLCTSCHRKKDYIHGIILYIHSYLEEIRNTKLNKADLEILTHYIEEKVKENRKNTRTHISFIIKKNKIKIS